jgi:hypothetical protein
MENVRKLKNNLTRTATSCLNCSTTTCVKHLLKICRGCAVVVLKDAPAVAICEERPVRRLADAPPVANSQQHPLPGLADTGTPTFTVCQKSLVPCTADASPIAVCKPVPVPCLTNAPPVSPLQLHQEDPEVHLHQDLDMVGDNWPLLEGDMALIEPRLDDEQRQHRLADGVQQQPVAPPLPPTAKKAKLHLDPGMEEDEAKEEQQISPPMPLHQQRRLWKTLSQEHRQNWEREEGQRLLEAEQRAAGQRASEVERRALELAEESERRRLEKLQAERAALFLKEQKLAEAARKLLRPDDDK